MSNATKFILAALVALFVTAAVSYANAGPHDQVAQAPRPLPGQWFIMGKIGGSPPDVFDFWTEKFFASQGECSTFMLTDPEVQKDLREYTENIFKEYPHASLSITCAQATVPGKDA